MRQTSRIELHEELLEFSANVYFQPPANIRLKYPCIIYHKNDKNRKHGNNKIYKEIQQYRVTVISPDPDSPTAEELEDHFPYCIITGYAYPDNINHTYLTLNY